MSLRDEEIIEMGQDHDGTFKPVAVVKSNQSRSLSAQPIPGKKVSAFYQFLDGFIVGLGAMEHFYQVLSGRGGRVIRRRR